MGIDGIPCGSSNRACDDPVFSKDRIDQAWFPNIWTTNQAKFDDIWIFFFCVIRKIFDDGIENIPSSDPVDRGYR